MIALLLLKLIKKQYDQAKMIKLKLNYNKMNALGYTGKLEKKKHRKNRHKTAATDNLRQVLM